MYSDEYSGEQYIFRTEDVLHFKTSHCLNGIVGLPVQYILKQTVEGVIESQRFLNNLYKNGLTAKAVLEYTGELNEDAATKLRQTFERFGAGSQNTGKILPVPLGMKLTPLDIKLTDSQFVELKSIQHFRSQQRSELNRTRSTIMKNHHTAIQKCSSCHSMWTRCFLC